MILKSGEIIPARREGVDLIRAGENFDLILVEKHMPIMNGVEVIGCFIILKKHLPLLVIYFVDVDYINNNKHKNNNDNYQVKHILS